MNYNSSLHSKAFLFLLITYLRDDSKHGCPEAPIWLDLLIKNGPSSCISCQAKIDMSGTLIYSYTQLLRSLRLAPPGHLVTFAMALAIIESGYSS